MRKGPFRRGGAGARTLALSLLFALFAGQTWAVQHMHADGERAVCEVCTHADHTPAASRGAPSLPERAQPQGDQPATTAAAPHAARYQPQQSRAPPSQQI